MDYALAIEIMEIRLFYSQRTFVAHKRHMHTQTHTRKKKNMNICVYVSALGLVRDTPVVTDSETTTQS